MAMKRFFYGMLFFAGALMISAAGWAADKEICITFDDLPVVRVPDQIERMIITDQILGTLEEYNVTAAGFVIGNNIKDDLGLVRQWLEFGHTIGNHTWSHSDLNDVPAELYIEDIDRGERAIEGLLDEFKQKNRFFRYPCLHYGNDIEKRKTVDNYLKEKKYRVAHVSVDTDDYLYNLQFEKMHAAADSIDFIALGSEYLDHIMTCLEESEKLAGELLGRPIKHVLLLHANRLNAFFLSDILAELELRGYKFISLEKALTDPVYTTEDGYMGPKGLSILERLAKSDPDLIPAREK